MKQKLKCFLGIFLSLALVLSLMPCMSLTVHADTTEAYADYDVTTDANKTKSGAELEALQVTFNGKPWYIIKDNSTALNAGTVTLLAADTSFGTSQFDVSSNAYSTSTIKGVLDEMTASGDFASVKDAIADTNLSDVGVTGAKLYLLSVGEANNLPTNVRKAKFTGGNCNELNQWWLRSPSSGSRGGDAAFAYDDGSSYVNEDGESKVYAYGVRPALKLDLSAVTFSTGTQTFTVKPYVSLKNTTTVITFDGKQWYLIDYDSSEGTVTLLSKECVAASKYNNSDSYVEYESSTVKGVVDDWYSREITAAAKKAVVDNKMFLLSTEEAKTLSGDVRICPLAGGVTYNRWWLRSRANDYNNAVFVSGEDGTVAEGGFPVNWTFGVRPALKLDLSAVYFSSVSKEFTLNPYADYDVTTDANKTKSGAELEALQVTFNGKPWYIIKDNSTALNAGTVTLLAADTSFGTSQFDVSSNAYSTSTIKGVLDEMTASGDFASVKDAIADTNLSDVGVTGAKLYLLSEYEAYNLPRNVRKAEFTGGNCSNFNEWWLRSPRGDDAYKAAFVYGKDGSVEPSGDGVLAAFGVRPALKLNLSAVHFSSASKEFTVNPYASLVKTTTPVKFNGIDWYIIADNSTAVNAGTVTLLAKDAIGKSKFHGYSNAYKDSDVKEYLEGLTNAGGLFADVANAIVGTDLTDVEVTGAKLWLLSTTEALGLNADVLKCFKASGVSTINWWLRSPGISGQAAFVRSVDCRIYDNGDFVNSELGVRPALQLDLSAAPFTSVNISGGENATPSGSTTQNYFDVSSRSAMTPVVYNIADEGYYFPTDYRDTAVNGGSTVNGISVTRDSFTQITVSGTPTADVTNITLTAPTVKTTPTSVPTAAAVDCTTSDNNDGKLTGVTTAMEYKKSDATDWAPGTGSDITGLVPETYYVRYKATDTTNASGNQVLTIAEYTTVPTYEVTYLVVNGTWSDDSTGVQKEDVQIGSSPVHVPTGMKPVSGYTGGAWDTDPANATITGPITFTYSFTALPTYEVTYKVLNGTWSDGSTGSKKETVQSGSKPSSVPTGMKPSSGYTGGAWDINPANATITGTTTFTFSFTKKPSPSPTPPSPSKPTAYVKTAPVANTLTYSEQPQELVTAGESTGGEMLYTLGNSKSSMPTSGWSTSIPTATDAGTYFVWYKAKGDSYHRDSSPKCVTVTIGKGSSNIKTPPTVEIKTLIGNGEPQELITAGEATGGTMQYAVGTDPTTAPEDGWSTEIPKVTDAGTYYIWYKVLGDDDHEGTEPSYAGAATIIENHSDNILAIDEENGIATIKDDVSGGTTEVPLYVITEGLTYRMYDPNRGEHFYTKNPEEAEALVQAGWIHENDSDFTVVSATEEDAAPVYRLYNPNCGGMHFYTTDAEEAKYLKSIGWNYEGISHYVYSAASTKGTQQHRLYNPNSISAEHLWTSDESEVDMLKEAGWIYEGICWRVA